VERPVRGGRTVLARPHAADPLPALEGDRVEADAAQRAQSGEARRAGSDYRDALADGARS